MASAEGQVAQVGAVHIQLTPQRAGYAPAQPIQFEVQFLQTSEVTQFRGYLSTKLVFGKSQPLKVGEITQLMGYLSAQTVVKKGQRDEVV